MSKGKIIKFKDGRHFKLDNDQPLYRTNGKFILKLCSPSGVERLSSSNRVLKVLMTKTSIDEKIEGVVGFYD